MINEADACVDTLRVRPIDQRMHIDRLCELYNVSRAGGGKGDGRERRESDLSVCECVRGGGGAARSLRCAALGRRGDCLLGPRLPPCNQPSSPTPRDRIKTGPDSQLTAAG